MSSSYTDENGDIWFPDDDPKRPNQESPAAQGKPSAWERLASGQTLGKKVVVDFHSTGVENSQVTQLNMFGVQTEDGAAQQLSILLSPPKMFVPGTTFPDGVENASGSLALDQFGLGGTAGAIGLCNPYAIVEWGIGGVSNSAEVDIANGQLLNVSASFVRITAAIQEPVLSAVISDAAYEFSAFIGPGVPKGSYGAQRTFSFRLAALTPSVIVPVPRFAKRVYVSGSSSVDWYAQLEFFRSVPLASAQTVSRVLFALNTPTAYPIPNGAYWFRVNSLINAVTLNQVVFELGI